MEKFEVIIAGAGYAGVMCALRLAGRTRRRGTKIALVSPLACFVERLRLHEGLVDPQPRPTRTFDLKSFLGKAGVVFIEASMIGLDRHGATVEIRRRDNSQRTLGFERLVVATGSTSRNLDIEGAEENAYFMEPRGRRNAAELRERLAGLGRPRVLVVGSGATGVEVAAETALRNGADVTLATRGAFGGFSNARVEKIVRRSLVDAGVGILEHCEVRRIGTATADTSHGELGYDVCVMCTGFRGQAFLDDAGLARTANGRLLVDAELRCVSERRIFAAGDACMTTVRHGAPSRMSVFFALASGAHVADCIADELDGKPPRPFGFWTFGQAIGLGHHAVGFANFPFDRPLPPYYRGRLGYQLRRFFVWLLFRLLVLERRWPGLPFCLGRPRRQRKRSARDGAQIRAA